MRGAQRSPLRRAWGTCWCSRTGMRQTSRSALRRRSAGSGVSQCLRRAWCRYAEGQLIDAITGWPAWLHMAMSRSAASGLTAYSQDCSLQTFCLHAACALKLSVSRSQSTGASGAGTCCGQCTTWPCASGLCTSELCLLVACTAISLIPVPEESVHVNMQPARALSRACC